MEFLSWVKSAAEQVGIKNLALEDAESASIFPSLSLSSITRLIMGKALYLHALDQVRDFRWRHWNFTREYIIKKTAHPTATGGSPIISVLPPSPLPPPASPVLCAVLIYVSSGYQTN